MVLGLVELIDAKGIDLAVRMSDIVSKSDSIQLEPVLSDLIQIINLGSNKGNLLALLTFRIVSWIVIKSRIVLTQRILNTGTNDNKTDQNL